MPNFDFLDSEQFIYAYNNKIATFFPNMDMPEITWDNVLEFINKHPEKRIGKKLLTSPYAFFHDEAQIITPVNSFVKQVHSKFFPCFKDPHVVTCQLFGSTMIEETGQIIHKHEDRENNIFWQGKGKSRWRLYDSLENSQPFMDIILEEKDLLFVPGGTYHYVEPIGPRFGFAILFGERK